MEIQYNEDKSPYVMWGEHKIQLEKETFTEAILKEKAENELRETPDNVETGLKELRELLKGEPNLSVPLDRDEFLLKFLRPCKFYAHSAFQKIKAYYNFKRTYKNYCDNLVPSEVKLSFQHSVITVLAPRDQHYRRIMLIESGERWNPQIVPLKEVFRGTQLALEGAMGEPRTQIAGVVVIIDMKGLSLTHVLQFTPSFAKMIVDWIQECTPIRMKAIHIINQPFIFNMLFAIFKPFLSQKLRSRIQFHGSNLKSLHAHIDPTSLRQRHGGTLPDPEIPGELMWKMLYHYEESYKIANSYGYTASK